MKTYLRLLILLLTVLLLGACSSTGEERKERVAEGVVIGVWHAIFGSEDDSKKEKEEEPEP